MAEQEHIFGSTVAGERMIVADTSGLGRLRSASISGLPAAR